MVSQSIRGIWFAIAVMAAAITGLTAALLASRDGASMAKAFITGAGTFGGALTLGILTLSFLLA